MSSLDHSGEIQVFEKPLRSTGPPVAVFGVAVASLFVSICLIPLSWKLAHLLGYGIAALVVPGLVVTFRTIDRQRQTNTSYIGVSWTRKGAVLLLGLAVFVAIVHAWIYAQERVLA